MVRFTWLRDDIKTFPIPIYQGHFAVIVEKSKIFLLQRYRFG